MKEEHVLSPFQPLRSIASSLPVRSTPPPPYLPTHLLTQLALSLSPLLYKDNKCLPSPIICPPLLMIPPSLSSSFLSLAVYLPIFLLGALADYRKVLVLVLVSELKYVAQQLVRTIFIEIIEMNRSWKECFNAIQPINSKIPNLPKPDNRFSQ